MLRRRTAAAALAALFGATFLLGANVGADRTAASSSDHVSTQQFRGVAGTRQIGPEFPHFTGREKTGSQAVYLVGTDARSAMGALVDRARALGFLKTPGFSPGSCSSAPYGSNPTNPARGEARVLCEGRYVRADGTMAVIDVTVCESCPAPTSTASVAIDPSSLTGAGSIPPLESISTTLDLPAGARRSVLAPTDASLIVTGFPQIRGARLAAPVLSASDLCADTMTAAFRITGDPTHAFDVYSEQLFGTGRAPKPIALRGGRRVTQRSDPDARLTLVEGETLTHPWMLASECNPLLD